MCLDDQSVWSELLANEQRDLNRTSYQGVHSSGNLNRWASLSAYLHPYGWPMDEQQLWHTAPSGRLEAGVPDFARWGEAAPFVALSERLYSNTCTLASDIDDFGTRVSDPAVVNHIVNRLAFVGSHIADIVYSLSGKLDRSMIDLDHWLEVLEAFDGAKRAFHEANGAAQAATEVMRSHMQVPR